MEGCFILITLDEVLMAEDIEAGRSVAQWSIVWQAELTFIRI